MKLSDQEFFSILRENAGLFARTARAIKDKYQVDYSRQAVRKRALESPELYKDILEENIDIAEEGLHSLMRSKNESVRLRAIDLFLKTKGKGRGYIEAKRVDLVSKNRTVFKPLKIIVKDMSGSKKKASYSH